MKTLETLDNTLLTFDLASGDLTEFNRMLDQRTGLLRQLAKAAADAPDAALFRALESAAERGAQLRDRLAGFRLDLTCSLHRLQSVVLHQDVPDHVAGYTG